MEEYRSILCREGRWDAFQESKLRWLEKLRELGVDKLRGDWKKEAWGWACVEHPPLELLSYLYESGFDLSSIREGVLCSDFSLRLEDLSRFEDVTGQEVAKWVFNMIDVQDISPLDAPSSGAWGLLRWARESGANRSKFYDWYHRVVTGREEALSREGTDERGEHVLHAIDTARVALLSEKVRSDG